MTEITTVSKYVYLMIGFQLLSKWTAFLNLFTREGLPDIDPALIRFLQDTARHGKRGLASEVFRHPGGERSPHERTHSHHRRHRTTTVPSGVIDCDGIAGNYRLIPPIQDSRRRRGFRRKHLFHAGGKRERTASNSDSILSPSSMLSSSTQSLSMVEHFG